jgi:hypothetical protein
MKKILIAMGIVALSLSWAVPAQATPNPANNLTQCTSAGGVFTQTGSGSDRVNICTLEVEETIVTKDVGQEGGKAFTVEVTTEAIYRTGPGYSGADLTPGESTSTCYNPGGDEVPSHIKPCQLP